MATLFLVGRLLLALVFAVAGAAKLADRKGSRQAVYDFGVPAALATPLAVLLPVVELVVAAALVPASTALWGALVALALLLLFVAGIGLNLARGRKPDCHCFGQLHSAPAGWKTLARNGVLAALAGFLVWQGWEGDVGLGVGGWILSPIQLLGLLGALAAIGLLTVQWWFLLQLLRQNGRLLVRLEALESGLAATGGAVAPSPNGATHLVEGLTVGAQAPAFSLQSLHSEALTRDFLLASGKPVVLLFTDPECGPCDALLPEIGRWQDEHSEKITLALISRGAPEENRAKTSEHGVIRVLLQRDWEVAEAYQVNGTPSAIVVRPDGTIGSPVAGGSEAIEALVSQAAEAPSRVPLLPGVPAPVAAPNGGPCPECGKIHPNGAQQRMPLGLEIGEQAPEAKLEDLAGKEIELKDHFGGEEILVLFWNPDCGFCQRMLPDLKEWEGNAPEDAPKLLVVSAGAREANEEMGLLSPVVLDQQFAAGRAFGAGGTPSAVLVDAEGKVASEVAVGAPAALELAGASRTEA